MKLPNWLRYLVYAIIVGMVAWRFLKPQERKFVNAIISGTDTMIVTGGVDASKCHAGSGYWNKTEDTFFHVFTNSIKDSTPAYSGYDRIDIGVDTSQYVYYIKGDSDYTKGFDREELIFYDSVITVLPKIKFIRNKNHK